jgi:bacteriocin biosynthesis cyclodehydratase domain-containing protein
MPVLLRPDGVVQIGWDPRRAVLVRPPAGATATGLADVLRSMHAPVDVAGLRKSAGRHGISDRDADEILGALLAASVAKPVHGNRSARTLSVRVHGCGPLSELLVEALRPSAARVCQTSHSNALGSTLGFDLVVLADYLVTDPRFIRELHQASIPHLTVRVRDGTGMVGPLVVPGVTSCLTCADLHRSDRDAAWPAVAAQLRDMVGSADRPVLLATAALALGQLHRIIAGVRGSAERPAAPPATLDATLEIDLENNAIRTRRWTRHPRCECTDWSALPPPRQG